MAAERDCLAPDVAVRRLPTGFRWPEGRKVAIVFNIAYEAWSDGVAPGVGPMGNPLPAGTFDTNALSWGKFGERQGISRLLRVLEDVEIRASVMVSGVLAARAPDIVARIAAANHEIVAHAFAQDIIPARLSADEAAADIARTTAALTTVAGKRPSGWISPRGTPSRDAVRLLLDAGYSWQGDVFDDDRPYIQTLGERHLIAIPLTMDINDLPHAMRFGRSPRQYIEAFEDLLGYALGPEALATMIDVTAHTHVYGRPAGAWAFHEVARRARSRDDAWIATRQDIADYVRATLL